MNFFGTSTNPTHSFGIHTNKKNESEPVTAKTCEQDFLFNHQLSCSHGDMCYESPPLTQNLVWITVLDEQ